MRVPYSSPLMQFSKLIANGFSKLPLVMAFLQYIPGVNTSKLVASSATVMT